MKKYIITSILCTLICVASFGQTLKRTMLSHEGTLTQYDINHWTDAINDAVAGDTVYFTSGTFYSGSITIDKSIVLIGPGIGQADCFNSIYADFCTLGESAKIDAVIVITASCFLEGLSINENVYFNVAIDGVAFRRCQFKGLLSSQFDISNNISNMTLESCYVNTLNCKPIASSNIYNCYIKLLENADDKGITFTNCVINGSKTSYKNNTFVNSIICSPILSATGSSTTYYYPSYSTFVNCIYGSNSSYNTFTNCWKLDNGNSMTADELLEGGYIGNDGTVVGPLGGPAPFSFIPSQPYISSSDVNYNASTKKLNVNITVKKGK